MADNNITEVGSNPTATSQDFDQYFNALVNDVVPRNSGGSPESEAGRLGTETYQWDELHVKNNVYINGLPISTSSGGSDLALTDSRNYVLSGRTRASDDNTPIYLLPSGSTNTCTISASSTTLEVLINGAATQFTSDVTITGLQSAPSSNNTCLVNDAGFTSQTFTSVIREIPIDTIGTEITALNGKVAGFSIGATEYFLAVVDTTNSYLLIDRRGSFINSSGVAFQRQTIADNATITLMKTAWVFAENTGTTGAVTYNNPYVSGTAPTSPSTGDYWYDLANSEWKVWSGSAWNSSNRVLIGVVLINSSGVAVASRCIDFRKAFNNKNSLVLRKFNNGVLMSDSTYNEISVYGNYLSITNPILWNMASDLGDGLSEASSTTYYFYLTHQGKPFITNLIPEWREDLQGAYHPYKSYRFVAECANDGSSNLGTPVNSAYGRMNLITSTGTSYWLKPAGVKFIKVRQCGAGSGGSSASVHGNAGGFLEKILNVSNISYAKCVVGAGSAGSSGAVGGNTTFTAYNITTLSCTGGSAAGTSPNTSTATGGDINLDGATSSNSISTGTPLSYYYLTSEAVSGYGAGGNNNNAGGNGVIIIDYIPFQNL